MSLWNKRADPIDRSVSELDRQIAAIQRRIHRMENGGPDRPAPASGGPAHRSVSAILGGFVKQMLGPPRETMSVTCKTRTDLFDVGSDALKELEDDPVAFAQPPDLFQQARRDSGAAAAAATAPAGRSHITRAEADPRLAQYLSAGSIRTYRPLKRVQRETRNRFFMWLGLSLVALWLMYAVIR